MSHSGLTILDAIRDPALFGRWFAGSTWGAWEAFLAALFGLPLTEPELATFRRHTGRQNAPQAFVREAWLVVGRRGGKSLVSALVAVYLAFFHDYRMLVAPGERATVMVIAADRRQAGVVFRYVCGLIDAVPMLAQEVKSRTSEALHLTNRVTIEVHTASFRSLRGYTVAAAICDEISFWRTEDSANPDTEILAALRPGMATIPSPMLLCISSPYARRGALWEAYKRHYGHDESSVLVWQADTRSMNPTISEGVIAEAYEQDRAAASADYGAEFRRDVEGLLNREAIEAVVVSGRRELPPVSTRSYVAFCDPSGGSQDSMTLAIAHHEDGKSVLDLTREHRPPFSPDAVVAEFAAVLKDYGLTRVAGDRYAGEWPRERFSVHGIHYEQAEQTKSETYGDLLPLINSGKVELLDHARLIAQLLSLERKTTRGGRDSIDHPLGCQDDLANVAAGALLAANRVSVAALATAPPPSRGERESIWKVDEFRGRRMEVGIRRKGAAMVWRRPGPRGAVLVLDDCAPYSIDRPRSAGGGRGSRRRGSSGPAKEGLGIRGSCQPHRLCQRDLLAQRRQVLSLPGRSRGCPRGGSSSWIWSKLDLCALRGFAESVAGLVGFVVCLGVCTESANLGS